MEIRITNSNHILEKKCNDENVQWWKDVMIEKSAMMRRGEVMNKKLVSVILGCMCFLLTFGISMQIKTVKNSSWTIGQDYEENNLRAEVLKYKERYDNKYEDLEKAEGELEKERQDSTTEDIKTNGGTNKARK